ncbi:MAG TPA: protein-glutamine glutaminase family protein [Rugosimonospora sp.]
MGYVIDASAQRPVDIYDPGTVANPVNNWLTVTAPAWVYRPQDTGEALVRVRILSGDRAGQVWWVPRDRLNADGNPYVGDSAQLDILARAMSLEQFTDTDGILRPVPFQNPAEMCSERAELMALRLEHSGYRVAKVLLIDKSVLRPYTIYGNDPPQLSDRASVGWWFHIAPIVYLGDDQHPFVFDPSLLDGAGTPQQWVARMTTANVDAMSYQTMVQRLRVDPRWPASPNDPLWLVIAPARVAGPPKLDDLDYAPETDEDSIAYFLQQAWESVPVRRAAAVLNVLLGHWRQAVNADHSRSEAPDPYPDYPKDLAAARDEFGRILPWTRDRLLIDYPNLLGAVGGTFTGSGVATDIRNLFALINIDLGTVG